MKNLIRIIVILFSFSLLSCSPSDEEVSKTYTEILGGKHELRKFNVTVNNTQTAHAWYFLVAGGYSSSSNEESIVRFYFLNCRNEYQLMEMSLYNVNIKIDSTVTTPYVKFYWTEYRKHNKEEFSNMYNYDVTKVVIYCKDSDFQPEININDLK